MPHGVRLTCLIVTFHPLGANVRLSLQRLHS
jgi:hypothetical protein